jgi:hypothetical protein
MRGPRAIDIALDVARMPRLARVLARRPLPPDILEVIRVAGSEDACHAAAVALRRPAHQLRHAARFYLQQVMLHPEADAFRVLGLRPGATRVEARIHLRWLLMWLHPDHNGDWEAPYAARVLAAWRELSAAMPQKPPSVPDQEVVPAHMSWIPVLATPARRVLRRRPGWLPVVVVSATLATACGGAWCRLMPSWPATGVRIAALAEGWGGASSASMPAVLDDVGSHPVLWR